MSWKTKSLRLVALSVIAGPTTLLAVEPRIIEPSPTPPKIVFETDSAPYNVLDKFRNARSSEQIHFQAIETLFPRVPEPESLRQGYTMVKELVDAKKAAIEAAAELEVERAKLEATRAELEKRVEAEKLAEEQWEVEPDEFDYYNLDDLEPQPEPQLNPTATTVQTHNQHHHVHHNLQRKTRTAARPSVGGILGRFFQR
jgi:hypothetical protein